MRDVLLVTGAFLACAVEAVEALTIVVAAGLGRGWRSAMRGVVAALVVLAAIVAALGPALSVVPLDGLRLVVGGLLLVFGLGWLRKAILRASGLKDPHDENAIYAREVALARAAADGRRRLVGDWYAFTLAFKGVLLEGLEVVFIVVTFGANQGTPWPAVIGAAAAVLVVTGIGLVVRGPLARVPENTIKFVVGVLLTSFGCFWGAEGAGAKWPGGDVALLGVLASVLAVALVYTAVLRRVVARRRPAPTLVRVAPK